MKAKYLNGTRVKVKYRHLIWSNDNGNVTYQDIRSELTEDIATIVYSYGEKSETDYRYSKGEDGYLSYCLKFDNHGEISWFHEKDLILIIEINENTSTSNSTQQEPIQ